MSQFAALAMALSGLTLLSTSPAPPGPNEQIIVEGQRERAEIDRFVDQLSPQQADIQLGKFLVPVCPGVVGLPDGQNELVEARMRTVAAAISAPVGGKGCVPDVIVIVARDKKEAIDDLQHRRPWLLGEISTPADPLAQEFARASGGMAGRREGSVGRYAAEPRPVRRRSRHGWDRYVAGKEFQRRRPLAAAHGTAIPRQRGRDRSPCA